MSILSKQALFGIAKRDVTKSVPAEDYAAQRELDAALKRAGKAEFEAQSLRDRLDEVELVAASLSADL